MVTHEQEIVPDDVTEWLDVNHISTIQIQEALL